MEEFIYTHQQRYSVDYIARLKLVKETATQIVAHPEDNPLNILRFNKSDGYLRGGSEWHPTKIIDYDAYKKLRNAALEKDIARFNKQLLELEKSKAAAIAKLL